MKYEMENKPLNIFNFSSLTDIVLLLLIFFLLTSQFVVQTGVKVKLPGSKTNEQTLPSSLVVTITPDKKILLGTESIGFDALAVKLAEAAKNVSDRNLLILADKDVNIDMVIRVIDAAKGVGIDKFTIQTEKETF